jgi:hypothetical protein
MHRLLHFAGAQKDIRPTIIGDQKPKAIAMADDTPRNKVQLAREQQHTLSVGQQLPISFHRRKSLAKYFARRFGHREVLAKLFWRQRGFGFAQASQDGFTGRNRGRRNRTRVRLVAVDVGAV